MLAHARIGGRQAQTERPVMKSAEQWSRKSFRHQTPDGAFWAITAPVELIRNIQDDARKEIENALRAGVGAAINEMISRGISPEWSRRSVVGTMLRALGCNSLELDDAVRAAIEPK